MATEVEVPHFAYPFRFSYITDSHAVVNEQDSLDDVVDCVLVSLLVEPRTRVEVPTFGTPSQVFENQPLNLQLIINSVELWESRAVQILSQHPDSADPLIAKLQDIISLRGAGGSV
jgi:hypothetical protein